MRAEAPPRSACTDALADLDELDRRSARHRPGRPHRAVEEPAARLRGVRPAARRAARAGAAGWCSARSATRRARACRRTPATGPRSRSWSRDVNERWGTADWTPIVLDIDDDYARARSLLRRADVLLVNPIRDGLNLVAKEGALVNERDAVLVLSDRAGVWRGLRDAVDSVNPFDVGATASALDAALRRDRRRASGADGDASRDRRVAHAGGLARRPAARRRRLILDGPGAPLRPRARRAGRGPARGRRPRGRPARAARRCLVAGDRDPDRLHAVRRSRSSASKAERSPASSPT